MAQGASTRAMSTTKHRRLVVKKASTHTHWSSIVTHDDSLVICIPASCIPKANQVYSQDSAIKQGEYVDHSVQWTLNNSVKGWDSVPLKLFASGTTADSGRFFHYTHLTSVGCPELTYHQGWSTLEI